MRIDANVLLSSPISIHAPREGSDRKTHPEPAAADYISIHAPREGSDRHDLLRVVHLGNISIHAPREGSDGDEFSSELVNFDFNPRSP